MTDVTTIDVAAELAENLADVHSSFLCCPPGK